MNQYSFVLSTVFAMAGYLLWVLLQPPGIGWPVFVVAGAAAPFVYEWFRGPSTEK